MKSTGDYDKLMEYRRSVAELYASARSSELDPAARWERFRTERDQLVGEHPQSPLQEEEKNKFTGLTYYDYDPALRYESLIEYDVDPDCIEIELQDDGLLRLQRFGRVRLPLEGEERSLSLFWVQGYGGGIFLPFKDATSGSETYGGGRYLLDTIKHADLGSYDGHLILDFNFAYNPSCAYNPRWHCPLSPPENNLAVAIRAGEKTYVDSDIGEAEPF
ncbi:DUF1684 domain-containing protein [soil metagenome]